MNVFKLRVEKICIAIRHSFIKMLITIYPSEYTKGWKNSNDISSSRVLFSTIFYFFKGKNSLQNH